MSARLFSFCCEWDPPAPLLKWVCSSRECLRLKNNNSMLHRLHLLLFRPPDPGSICCAQCSSVTEIVGGDGNCALGDYLKVGVSGLTFL